MKRRRNLFEIYPHNFQATNLSIAGGAAHLVTILLLIAAAFVIAAILMTGVRYASYGQHGNVLLHLIDEMDDELEMLFVLAGAAAMCGYAARALKRKAEMMIAVEEIPNH